MKKSTMVYKCRESETRIAVEKKDSSTWSYVCPKTGETMNVTRHELKQQYKYMPKESKLKRFEPLKLRSKY